MAQINVSDRLIVTAAQMQAIEALMFGAGMPVPALMEKVAGLICDRLETLYPISRFRRVGILAGPGHNGGDALVVARELWHRGREIQVHLPLAKFKPIAAAHWQYFQAISAQSNSQASDLKNCDLLIDGIFGFGLEREITAELADLIDQINQWHLPILSIDLPSGIHTDTGAVMGTALKARHTLCLGLWKRGLLIESALAYIGKLERIDFDIPAQFIQQVLGQTEQQVTYRIQPLQAIALLPMQRPIASHKYQMGHLLLVGGSQQYGGAVILAALAARASGVGMLSIAVPLSLRDLVLARVPEALVIGCAETNTGAIAHLPDLDFAKYNAIACGVGISLDAKQLVEQILKLKPNLVLDADALSLLAQIGVEKLKERSPLSTVLTPHWGEFQRLFPLAEPQKDRLMRLQNAAIDSGAVVLLKGARTSICSSCDRQTQTWINPESTPALARGGSGDVLTGLIGGLLAQGIGITESAIAAIVWHSQTAIWLAKSQTEMAVNPSALVANLLTYLSQISKLPSTND